MKTLASTPTKSQLPLTPNQRATKLGLTSTRFHQHQLSDNAKQQIEYAKKKDRPQLKSIDWQKKQFYQTNITQQLYHCRQNITRIHTDSLPISNFIQQYEKYNLPIVIQGCTKNWNIDKYWTFQYFYKQFKEVKFKIGQDDDGYKIRVPLKYYLQYLIYNIDDSPLYMFESSLQNDKHMQKIIDHYEPPPYFLNDLLKYAGQKRRPPYRWLLMGPQRSGSTIHIDPLNTSAWNTSLQGYKRWVLFPEEIPKSVVKGKKYRGKDYTDQSINYFTEILPQILQQQPTQKLGIIQFIQNPGDTVFIPGGWWHAVLNLNDTIAVTQNIMTEINFDLVWRSLRTERKKFANKFLRILQIQDYGLYERAVALNQKDNYEMGHKYEQQSVSLSFTQTQSSSSSSFTQSQQNQYNHNQNPQQKNQKNKRRKSEDRHCNFSRSRDKLKQKKNQSLNPKTRKPSP